MSTFEKLFATVLSDKFNFKETAIPTKVFILGDMKVLDKETYVKLNNEEKEVLKKMVEVGNFKIIEGEWGARCRLSYVLGSRRFSNFCNIYHEDYSRDFEEGEISEEDKNRVVIVFYETPNDFRFTVYIMDEPVSSIDDAISKLKLAE